MNPTTYLKLQKPTSDEKYNVAIQNSNMDILDSEVKKLQEVDKNLLSKATFNEHSSNHNNPHSVTKTQLGLGNVNNVRQLPVITDAVTPNGVPVFDGNGYKLMDSGFLLEASVPSNAKFTDTVYVHPKSDILEGTYNSVFVNNDGHVLRGENPTTLSGYGITDGETKGSAATALIDAKKYTDVQVASVQSGSGLKKMIVATLPTANIDQNTLYLVPSGKEASENKYKEYLNLDGTSNGWEYVGNSNVDLTDYYNKSEANRLFLLKDNITQSNVNDSGKVPSSALLYENHNSLQEKITSLNNKIKLFYALSDLGLNTTDSYTCLDIAKVMPNNSRLVIDGGSNISDIPNAGGFLIIERINAARVLAFFYNSSLTLPNTYVKYIRVSENKNGTWSKMLVSNDVINNLLSNTPGKLLDAMQGKALDDKITDINRKLNTIKIYTVTPQPGYHAPVILEKNGVIYIKCSTTFGPAEAWTTTIVGKITEWTYGDIGFVCSLHAPYGEMSSSVLLYILANGDLAITTHAAAPSERWYFGTAAILVK